MALRKEIARKTQRESQMNHTEKAWEGHVLVQKEDTCHLCKKRIKEFLSDRKNLRDQ